ncbi:hypothetical protein AC579_7480 [Pseudocercospora musae]|uniref:Granulins domain-containing protein n=1 Tax=Pseudocercospora musae TaxID=113226 RepID=A0A139ID04_9PEZI|nr:hypothetical protein AC579_7480 [Pseudocercospora musae]
MHLLTLVIATLVTLANAAIPTGTNGVDVCYCPSAGCVNGVCSTVGGPCCDDDFFNKKF